MERDKLLREMGKKELEVLEERMVQPMREHLLKRGLSNREIDQVFDSELNKHIGPNKG